MRTARISKTDAFYGASASAQNSEAIDEEVIDPIDLDEIADVNLTPAIDNIAHGHIQGFDELKLEFSKNVTDRIFLRNKKRVGNPKPILKRGIYFTCEKR